MKAENINLKKTVDFDYECHSISVKGIKFNGEYIVDVIVKNGHNRTIINKHIECKRIGTINKVIAPYGVTI